jgi:hypothetical protein
MDFKDLILIAVGIGLSIVFRIPFVDTWFQQTKFNNWRGWMMAGFSLVVAAVMFGISCTPLFQFVPCNTETVWSLARSWVVLFAGNQLFNLIPPSTPAALARKGA